MKKKMIPLIGVILFAGGMMSLEARDRGEGVRLATDIVRLVKTVVAPAPVVVAPAPAPVVVAPAPAPAPVAVPAYSYGYYNNVYVPMYNGWYYYGNVWCWGGRGPRPRYAPRWVPPPRRHYHRPAPPPPPRRHYHRPPPPRHAPPPPRHGGRPHHHGGRR